MFLEPSRKYKMPEKYNNPRSWEVPNFFYLLQTGEARIVKRCDIPQPSDFEDLNRYMKECKYTLTYVGPEDQLLDKLLNNVLTPEQKKRIVGLGARIDGYGNIEKNGSTNFRDLVLTVRPTGIQARAGFNKISIGNHNRHNTSFILDMSYLPDVESTEDIIPILETCMDLELKPSTSCTLASLARNYLLDFAGSAFRNKEGIGPDWEFIYECSLNAVKAGRTEGYEFGFFENLYYYDFKFSFPTEMAKLQHAGGRKYGSVEETFTVWKRWDGNWEDMQSPELVYAFLLIEEDIRKSHISYGTSRCETYKKSLTVHPYGKARRWIGKHSFWSRMKRGSKFEIIDGCIGYAVNEHLPFRAVIRKLELMKESYPSLAKKLSVRLHGNCLGTYDEVVRDYSVEDTPFPLFRVQNVGLATFGPMYAADVMDSMNAKVTDLLLEHIDKVPVKCSTDGILFRYPIPEEDRPEGFREKYNGPGFIYNDQLSDRQEDGKFKWRDQLEGNYIVIHKETSSSMRSNFRSNGESLMTQQEKFDMGGVPLVQRLKLGSSKRILSNENIDFLTESTTSRAPGEEDMDSIMYKEEDDEDADINEGF